MWEIWAVLYIKNNTEKTQILVTIASEKSVQNYQMNPTSGKWDYGIVFTQISIQNTFFDANNDETKTKWNKIWMKMLWTKKVFYLAFRSYSEATKEEMEVWEKNLWKIM